MNVLQATIVFICFIAAKGNFPAVIFQMPCSLATPRLLAFSDSEVEVGFYHCKDDPLYFACPLDQNQREKYEIPEALLLHEIETAEKLIYSDQQLLCELQPQVTIERVWREGEYFLYSVGYRVYNPKTKYEDNIEGSRLHLKRDRHGIGNVFALDFNTSTKKTISVEYQLHHSRFISTASNKKHTFVYKKNEELLGIDLDFLYQNFVDQILPRMLKEKSENQLAHELGIQKVQLATPHDFVLDTWKVATYWNINTVPIWRVLILRWNAIEIYLRKLHKRDIDVTVKTGVSGTLEITDNDEDHKLNIPKYVWKLIPELFPNKIAMLIIMHNDPFTEHQQPLCEDICAINGWLVSNNDYRTGLVYCCKFTEDIAQILGYIDDSRDHKIYSFTKNEDGMENLKYISRILSDPQEKFYDW